MRLNGWQRLWVVLAVLWTLGVGLWAWSAWPKRPLLVVATDTDPHDPKAPPLGYHEALSREQRPGKYDLTGVLEPETGLIVHVPSFGRIQFPAEMSTAEVDQACQTLLKARAENIRNSNAGPLREFQAQRTSTVQTALTVWILPPLALLALGLAVSWVFRGFPDTRTAIHLNGWQRLWVVLTLLWTVVLSVFVWVAWPRIDYDALARQFGGVPVPAFNAPPVGPLGNRVETLLLGAALWLIPVVLCGLVLWVYRGFRSKVRNTPPPPPPSIT